MGNWLTGERLVFLAGYPVVMFLLLYLSALLGIKGQGAWLRSTLYRILSKSPGPVKLVSAAVVGAVTPFCSCTTIPGFVAILEADLGLAAAMAFLIASPTLDPAGMAILVWLLGAKFALLYLAGCFLAAVAGGWLLGKIFGTGDINPILLFGAYGEGEVSPNWGEAARGAFGFVGRFWWVIILSAVAGFALYDYVPADWIGWLSGNTGILAVPLASVLGMFVYAHMAVLAPVGAALVAKGMAPGVVIAFLAASAGISPPEIILLRNIVSFRLLAAYLGVSLMLITIIGFIAYWVG